MAIVETYVDPSIAADSGAGTIGDPYGDLEYALEQTTPGTDGDRFNIKAGTAEVLEFALDIVTDYGTPTDTAPLVFQGYTSAQGDGGIGEISGGGSVSIINNNALDYVSFLDLKLGNTGSAVIIDLDNWCHLIRCEIHTTSSSNPVQVDANGSVVDCYFHTWTDAGTGGSFVSITSGGSIERCFIDAGTVNCSGGAINHSSGLVIGNIVHVNHVDAVGISYGYSTFGTISGNSVFNEAAGTSGGILFTSSTASSISIQNNIVEGWSGTGGFPIEATNASSGPLARCVNNVYFNNDTDSANWAGAPPFIEESNATSTASPFTDAANDDFTVTTEAQAAAFVQVFRGAPDSTNIEDVGACQRLESGGGGGGMRLVGTGGLITPA